CLQSGLHVRCGLPSLPSAGNDGLLCRRFLRGMQKPLPMSPKRHNMNDWIIANHPMAGKGRLPAQRLPSWSRLDALIRERVKEFDMVTDYDPIAAEYQKAKQHPWRLYVERHTLLQLIGDIRGQSVLDMACGEGHYTRELRRLGADRVVGVDLSAGMIRLAQEQ